MCWRIFILEPEIRNQDYSWRWFVALAVQVAETWGLRAPADGATVSKVTSWIATEAERPNTRHFRVAEVARKITPVIMEMFIFSRQGNIRHLIIEVTGIAEAKDYDEVTPLQRFRYFSNSVSVLLVHVYSLIPFQNKVCSMSSSFVTRTASLTLPWCYKTFRHKNTKICYIHGCMFGEINTPFHITIMKRREYQNKDILLFYQIPSLNKLYEFSDESWMMRLSFPSRITYFIKFSYIFL